MGTSHAPTAGVAVLKGLALFKMKKYIHKQMFLRLFQTLSHTYCTLWLFYLGKITFPSDQQIDSGIYK